MESLEQIQTYLHLQKEYFFSGATDSIDFRIAQLQKLKKLIQNNEQQILNALAADLGKSEFEAYASEIGMIYEEINFHLKHIRRWTKQGKRSTSIIHFPAQSYVYHRPLEMVLIIGTF